MAFIGQETIRKQHRHYSLYFCSGLKHFNSLIDLTIIISIPIQILIFWLPVGCCDRGLIVPTGIRKLGLFLPSLIPRQMQAKPSGVERLETIQVQKRAVNNHFVVACLRPLQSRAKTAEKCTKKCDARAKFLFLRAKPIVCLLFCFVLIVCSFFLLTFWLPSRRPILKFSIVFQRHQFGLITENGKVNNRKSELGIPAR